VTSDASQSGTEPILRPAIHGLTDPLALAISYNFASTDLRSAISQPMPSEPLRTMYHEMTHLIQSVGTNYGQFLRVLRNLQNYVVQRIMASLREHDLPVKRPLIKYIETLKPADRFESIHVDVSMWQVLEVLYAVLEGDWDYSSAVASRSNYLGWTPDHLFNQVCRYFDWIYQLSDHGIDMESHLDLDSKFSNTIPNLILKATGDIDVRNVLEGGGAAAEVIDDRGTVSRRSTLSHRYTYFVNLYLHDHPSISASDFATTFLALSDLALNGALLPVDGVHRRHGGNFDDLHPLSRMFQAIGAAKRLPPIGNFCEEYAEFIAEICDTCGWATPQRMSQTRLDQLEGRGAPGTPSEHITRRYVAADIFRNRHKGILLDPRFWHGASTKLSPTEQEYFGYSFTPPIMMFADGTRDRHGDKAYFEERVLMYMAGDYLRKVFVRRDAEVDIPYDATPDEAENWRRALLHLLEHEMGLQQPNVVTRTRRASFVAH
jgi:hypothetical protein